MSEELQSAGEQWEYKFLRCGNPLFRDTDGLQSALAEESAAGWSLVEKLDDRRIRLKRPVSARDHDGALGLDPYRTMTPSMLAEVKRLGNRNLIVVAGFILIVVIIFAVALS